MGFGGSRRCGRLALSAAALLVPLMSLQAGSAPDAAAAQPVSVPAVSCPAPPPTRQEAVPGVAPESPPRRATIPAAVHLPPAAAAYGTGLIGGTAVVIGPAAWRCTAAIGYADGGSAVTLTPEGGGPGQVQAVFEAGGIGPNDALACPYNPAALAAYQALSGGSVSCDRPSTDTVTQLPTGSSADLATLVSVPPEVKDPNLAGSGDGDRTVALFLVAASAGPPPSVSAQAVSCTLPAGQIDVCAASLADFLLTPGLLTTAVPGRTPLPASGLASALAALDAGLASSGAPAQPATCNLESEAVTLEGHVTDLVAYLGGQGTVTLAATNTHKLALTLAGQFQVGLSGEWGTQVALGGDGVGVDGSVAGGLLVGGGATLTSTDPAGMQALVSGLQTSTDAAVPSDVALTQAYLQMGAWLNGDVGVGPARGAVSAQGVVGAKVDYADDQPTDVEYYIQVSGSLAGTLGLPFGDVLPDGLAAKGEGQESGSLLVGLTTDPTGNPTAVTTTITTAVTAGDKLAASGEDIATFLGQLKALAGGAAVDTGQAVTMTATLDLVDQNTLADVDRVLDGAGSDAQSLDALDQLFLQKGTVSAVGYAVRTAKASASVSAGEGAGVGLGLSGNATMMTATWALYAPPGGPLQAWTACLP